jgi:hypothetical protein
MFNTFYNYFQYIVYLIKHKKNIRTQSYASKLPIQKDGLNNVNPASYPGIHIKVTWKSDPCKRTLIWKSNLPGEFHKLYKDN